MRTNLFALVQDAFRLIDLQFQLLSIDVREFWQKARTALIISVVAGIACLAALPVLLLGIAYLLQDWLEISFATAAISISLGMMAICCLGAWVSIHNLTRAGGILGRSKKEWQENVAWFRSSFLKQDDD
ncbi:phage holin family protein [Planctomicrobium sp. SH664]|uniref:phage holin family protein n=1 Tax=Planctomicrobium sp. SH664 TaxID=3448125 RepID=UPI003F5C3C23